MSSPSPTPVRAVYGFVLYLATYVGFGNKDNHKSFVLYIIWAYIPNHWLDAVGLTYWPQKYWAVAVPCYLCVVFLLAFPAWFGYICLCTPPLHSMDLIKDDFSPSPNLDNLPEGAAPPLADLSISEVNRKLYL